MDICQCLQFDFVEQHVCFYANTMLFFFFYYSYEVQLEIGNDETFSSPFIVQDRFSYLGFLLCFVLFFHMNLRIVLSRFAKNHVEVLMGIAFNGKVRSLHYFSREAQVQKMHLIKFGDLTRIFLKGSSFPNIS